MPSRRERWSGAVGIKPVEAAAEITEEKLTRAEAVKLLWSRGELRWKLDENQRGIYDQFKGAEGRSFVLNCSRQLGKSYLLCVIALEFANKNPNTSIKFCAPTAKQVRNILRPLFRQILRDCPEALRPTENKVDGNWDFPNGSNIVVAGADAGNAESLRGQHAHLCLIDEAGFISDLKYVADDILFPQMLTTAGRMLYVSTPPKSPGHHFVSVLNRAKLDNAYAHRTVYANPRLTKSDIEACKRQCGGEDTVTWRREYLAEIVVDITSAVIPEFTAKAALDIIREVERPDFFDRYTALDVGMIDATAGLFGYWHFPEAQLVIEDEFVLKGPTTSEIAGAVKEGEARQWGATKPYMRVSDIDLRLQADFQTDHKLQLNMVQKDDKEAAINGVRLLVLNRKLKIHPRCVNLIMQLNEAVWNNNRTTYERTDSCGHFDLIDALVYMTRSIHRHHNPFPAGTVNRNTHWQRTGSGPALSDTHREIQKWFSQPQPYFVKSRN